MISAVFVNNADNCKFVECFANKAKFRRTYRRYHRNNVATFLHATDYDDSVAVYPANVWGYLKEGIR